tara:strand:- start:467 stop:1771 length:1305 start_codon:yes stop_codon:yes gene_type:complete
MKGEPIYRCPSCKSIKVKKSDLKCPVCFELLPTDLEPEYYSTKKDPFKKSSGIGCFFKVFFGLFGAYLFFVLIMVLLEIGGKLPSSSNNQSRFRREYCSKTTSGKTVCIKREHITCSLKSRYGANDWGKTKTGDFIICKSYGIMTDILGNKSHWSSYKPRECLYTHYRKIFKGFDYDDTFTCSAAKYTGKLEEFRPIQSYSSKSSKQNLSSTYDKITSARKLLKSHKEYLKGGTEKYYSNNYAVPISNLNKAIRINPKYASDFYLRGRAKLELKDYSGAINDFEKAIKLDSLNDFSDTEITYQSYIFIATAKLGLKDYSGAINPLNKFIELDPTKDIGYFSRCTINYKLEKYNNALLDCNKAISINKNKGYKYNSYIYNIRGNIKYALGDKEGGCIDYKKSLSIKSKTFESWERKVIYPKFDSNSSCRKLNNIN